MDTNNNNRGTTTTSLQMPIGYRFPPTDHELIIHYFLPKVFSFPLPTPAILHSHHLFLHHPSRLPSNSKEKRYFFCKTSYPNNSSNPAGYWKPVVKNNNIHKLILDPGSNRPIGFKKSFVFYQFSHRPRSASRTPWILQEFCLLYPLLFKMGRVGMEEWVVCSIHMKSRKAKNQHKGPAKRHKKSRSTGTIDDDNGFGASTSSSGITCNDDAEEEESALTNN